METGYYTLQKKIIHHDAVEAVEEKYHLEVVKEYPNGGKDYHKVIDVEGVPPREAYDEEIEEKVWVEYTKEELTYLRIGELKKLLSDSDYKAVKYMEGYYTEEEYASIKQERQSWRDEINELEKTLK